MGGGISTIIDLALLTHSIEVRVTLQNGIGGWQSAIHCAAFPKPTWEGNHFNWHHFTTVARHPAHGGGGSYVMPVITHDAHGNPITPDTEYKVRCGIDPDFSSKDFLSTWVRTPEIPYMCETGVKLNGVEAPKVLMEGQTSLDLSGTTWFNFPKSMDGMHAHNLPRPVPAGSTIEMKCCPGEECAFFFALYNCAACTGPKPAGLAQTLVLDGWDTGACSPQFDDNFKSTAFHKSVNAVNNEIVMTYNVAHDELMAVFGLEGSIQEPWCAKQHGPAVPGGAGCGAHCPTF